MSTTLPPILLFPWGRAQTPVLAPPSQPGPDPNAILTIADVSNFTGRITDAQVEAMKAAGIAGAIVRIDTADPERIAIMQQQLAVFRSHSMPVAGYVFPDYDQGVAAFLADLFALTGELRSLWIDLELVSGVMPTSFSIFRWWMSQAAMYCPPATKLGVYTAAWVVAKLPAWQPLPYPLWLAAYGERPSSLAVNVGGWTLAAGIQYSDKGDIAGVSCDLSVFQAEAF